MPTRPVRVLCIHGIGGQEKDLGWQDQWRQTIRAGITTWSPDREVRFEFVPYDELFDRAPLDPLRVIVAVGKLAASGIFHGVEDLFHRGRGLSDLPEAARWTAGMIVQWAEDDRLRKATRQRVLEYVRAFDPEVVCAHSLGSLVAYDTFVHEGSGDIGNRTFVTLGSQIGNPFVRGTFGGRIVSLQARAWFHLFNRNDDVFTSHLRIEAEPGFAEVETDFDIPGLADHDALEYLKHPNTIDRVWRAVATTSNARSLGSAPGAQALGRAVDTLRSLEKKKPRRRALLIGINEYPDPKDRLEGCVNDVFLMSALLQENGYDAEDIRVVLDKRATTGAICDRLGWLLEDTGDQAERFLYYSGHGAQIPAYGADEKIDRLDECLVPWDFDWSREKAITDDQFVDLYSQLPYDARFVAVFDCCHSGGMTREGGMRVRGLSPPDDIRHRALRWDAADEMWIPRDFVPQNKDLARKKRAEYVGKSGAKLRLGRAVALRQLPDREYDSVRAELGHFGPYLPVIVEACGEDELSYEYRHGAISQGAFTWSLVRFLRNRRKAKQPLMSWDALIRAVGRTLAKLDYDQKPQVIGPKKILASRIPWR